MSRSKPVVLMLLPALDYDPTESAVIWDALAAAGIDLQFATPSGEPAYADSRLADESFSVLSPVLMTKPESVSVYRRMTEDPHFRKTRPYEAVDLDNVEGLFIPGRHAKAVRTMLESSVAQQIAVSAFARDLPVGRAVTPGLFGVTSGLRARSTSLARTTRGLASSRQSAPISRLISWVDTMTCVTASRAHPRGNTVRSDNR